jgi:hypothetical protein
MRISGAIVLLVTACGGGGGGGPDAGPGEGDAASGAPTAAALLARIARCDLVVGGSYAADNAGPVDISICGYPGAVAWQADLDVDCDGQQTTQCNLQTDPDYLNQTAATDSNGDPLDAAALPYVVIPGTSMRFDFRAAGLDMGTVVAVIFGDHVEYGVLGDVGPTAIIGEASYRMAELLGIDPDPSTGGAEGGVAYIAFTGDAAMVNVIEDHPEAVALGTARALALLAE